MSQKTWDEGEKNFISHPLIEEREREPERAGVYILYQKTSGILRLQKVELSSSKMGKPRMKRFSSVGTERKELTAPWI